MFNSRKEIPWKTIESTADFDELFNSAEPFIVFKHSTRCSISTMAFRRLMDSSNFGYEIYYLDLIKNRALSNYIADKTSVEHHSPQVIAVNKSAVVGSLTHSDISEKNLEEILS